MVVILTPGVAMDFSYIFRADEAHGYHPRITDVIRILNEIAQGEEPVALIALTVVELECLSNPEESTHLNDHATARQKIRDAVEQLAQMQEDQKKRDDESQRYHEQLERDRAFLERPPAVLPRQNRRLTDKPE